VNFEPTYKTFDNYMDLKFHLENLLGVKIDLVIKESLKEELKDSILTEAIYF
jgi:predicted nucleotidyltransferase